MKLNGLGRLAVDTGILAGGLGILALEPPAWICAVFAVFSIWWLADRFRLDRRGHGNGKHS